MSLKKAAISGLFWTFSQQFGVQTINFVVQIVMARLLLPSEFGIIGMITIFIAVGNSLMDSGLTSSLIRFSDASAKDYSTVFFINVLGSLAVYLILFCFSPAISIFFNQEILVSVVRIYALSFLIRAFSGVQEAKLTKELKFKKQLLMQLPSIIVGGLLGIFLAYRGYGVWSLVWMNLCQTFLYTAQLWLSSNWYPAFIFDKKCFKYHFNFGYKLTLAGLLDTIYQNVYHLIIGKLYSATQLGFYTRAYSLRQFPVQNMSAALNKVTYPLFSSIQKDDVKLKLVYKKLMIQVVFWIAPLMVLLIVVAEPLFRFVLTEKWLPAVPYFQILCIAGVMYPLHSYNLNILKVKGRSDLFFKLEIIKKVYITIGICCAIPFGIYGLLYFQLISTCIAFFINTWYSGSLINYSAFEQIRDISPIYLLAGLTGLLTWLGDYCLFEVYKGTDILRITLIMPLFFLIYLCASFLFKLDAIADFRQLVLKR